MNALLKKAPANGDWWRKLVSTLKWNKNAGLPLSEKYWQDMNDKIMSQIEDHEVNQGSFVDKKKTGIQISVEV